MNTLINYSLTYTDSWPEKSSELEFTDQELWKNFKSGSEVAFAIIYDKYFDSLVRYCGQFDFSKVQIEDLLQDFFIELRTKRNKLGDVLNIKAYLFKSVRRVALRLKKSKNRFMLFHGEEIHLWVESVENDFVEKQNRDEYNMKVNKALQKIPSRQKEVIFYYYYEDFSYDQIKCILGYKSNKIVRNLLYKSIRSLRKAYFDFM